MDSWDKDDNIVPVVLKVCERVFRTIVNERGFVYAEGAKVSTFLHTGSIMAPVEVVYI